MKKNLYFLLLLLSNVISPSLWANNTAPFSLTENKNTSEDEVMSMVTFQVDMTGQTVSPNGIHIAGDFQQAAGFPNNWTPNTTALTNTSGNIYAVTVNIPDGSYQYKFINGTIWAENETVPGSCVVPTTSNRGVVVAGNTTIPVVGFGQCPPAPSFSVTFKVDMTGQTVGANGVHIAGSFQSWNPATTALTNTSGNIWEVTVPNIPAGNIQYKFINGNAWADNEVVPPSCNVGGNRTAIISANTTLSVVFGQCPVAPINVTFKVDMTGQTIGANGVHLAGSFQGTWDPATIALTNTSGNIWEVTVPNVPAGNIEYKFVNGNAWGSDESVPAACAVNNNRGAAITVTTTLPTVCYAQCGACVAGVTFQVDMSGQTVGASGMFVAGSFQVWNATANPMTNMGNGIWKTTVMGIPPGAIQYKFINGSNWEAVPGTCQVGGNRGATVAAGTVLPLVCFAQCAACPTVTYSVTFQVDMTGRTVSANGVHIAGSFQGWNPSANPLINQGNGIWATTINGIAGNIEYKFINGNAWPPISPAGSDESVPSACASNGNRTANITANTTIPLVCFGLCTACPVITYSATFSVDMTGKTVSPNGVHIAGNFQNWDPAATLLTNNGNGIWSKTVSGLSGPIEYKFINGSAWGPMIDETVDVACANTGGNRTATITSNTTIPVVCYEQCSACAIVLAVANTKIPTCYGKSDGEATVGVTGGSGCTPTFLWSNGATGATATGLKSDLYKVTATCGLQSAVITVFVREPAEVRFLTQTAKNISCTSAGEAAVTASGGVGNISFLWSNGATGATASVTAPGTYTVTATDANNCSLANTGVTVNVDQGVPAAKIANINPSLDCTTKSLVLDASTSTGGGILTYQWSGTGITAGATSNKATINKAGNYTISVTSSNGCASSKSISVSEDIALPIIKMEGDSSICAADTALLRVAGTYPTYAWSNGATTQSIKPNTAGAYKVTVTGTNGCQSSAYRNVSLAPQPSVTIATDTLTCVKTSITLNAVATGTLASSVWSGPNAYSADSLKAKVTKAGKYTLTAKSNDGCIATFSTTIGEDKTPVTLALQGKTKLCSGDSSILTATPNIAAYLWSNGNKTNSINVKTAGTYKVTATAKNGCFKTDSIKVAVSSKMMVTLNSKVECNNIATVFAAVTGGTPNYSYAWTGSAVSGNPLATTAPATINVTITDDFGCKAIATPTTLVANTAITITATVKVEISSIGLNVPGAIDITVNGGVAPYTYKWSNNATTQDLPSIPADKYCVTITDSNTCIKTECFSVGKSVGTSDNALANAITVFPNPIEDVLNIDTKGNVELTRIELLDCTGRVLQQFDGTTKQISTAHLSDAIYLLKCSNKEGYAIKKIVKLK
jgi:hypothetical protein